MLIILVKCVELSSLNTSRNATLRVVYVNAGIASALVYITTLFTIWAISASSAPVGIACILLIFFLLQIRQHYLLYLQFKYQQLAQFNIVQMVYLHWVHLFIVIKFIDGRKLVLWRHEFSAADYQTLVSFYANYPVTVDHSIRHELSLKTLSQTGSFKRNKSS